MTRRIEESSALFDVPQQKEIHRISFCGKELYSTLPLESLTEKYHFGPLNKDLMLRRGINPLSIREILNSRELWNERPETMVFFDTPGKNMPGNCFRIIEIDCQKEIAVVQLCDKTGIHDIREVSPFVIGFREGLFRGVSIQYLYLNVNSGKLNLSEAIMFLRDGHLVQHCGGQLFIADGKKPGDLIPAPSEFQITPYFF